MIKGRIILILTTISLSLNLYSQNELIVSIGKTIPLFKDIDNKLDKNWIGGINLENYYSHKLYKALFTGIGFDYTNCRLNFSESQTSYNSNFFSPYVHLRYKFSIFNYIFISPKLNIGYSILRIDSDDWIDGPHDNGFNLTSQFDLGIITKNKLSFSLYGKFNITYSSLIPLFKIWINSYDKTIKYCSIGISVSYLIDK